MSELKVFERGFTSSPGIELRGTSDDGMLEFRGYAAVWDEPYDMGKFDEVMRRGSWAKTLSLIGTSGRDIAFYDAHDPRAIIARTSNGTLKLAEDSHGLRVEARLDPSDLDVQRLVPKIRSGLVTQMSHGRITRAADWDRDRAKPLRSVTEAEGLEVSTVSNPAAPQTTAELLAYGEALGLDVAELKAPATVDEAFDALIAAAEGRTITPDQASRARTAVESLRSVFQDEAEHLQPEGAEHLHSLPSRSRLAEAMTRIRSY